MVYLIDLSGTTKLIESEPIYQGSSLANRITLLAKMTSGNVITAAFRLPNGLSTTPHLMTSGKTITIGGEPYNSWSYTLDEPITEYAGIVDVQFFVYQGYENLTASAILATYKTSFEVLPGVVSELPLTPSQTIYEEILTALSNSENKTFGKLELYGDNVYSMDTWIDAQDAEGADNFLANRIDPTKYVLFTNGIFNSGKVTANNVITVNGTSYDWTVAISASALGGQILSIATGQSITITDTGIAYDIALNGSRKALVPYNAEDINLITITKQGVNVIIYLNNNKSLEFTLLNSGTLPVIAIGNTVDYTLTSFKLYRSDIDEYAVRDNYSAFVYRCEKIIDAEKYRLDLAISYAQDIARILQTAAGFDNVVYNPVDKTLSFYTQNTLTQVLHLNNIAVTSERNNVEGVGNTFAIPPKSAAYAAITQINGNVRKDNNTLYISKITDILSKSINLANQDVMSEQSGVGINSKGYYGGQARDLRIAINNAITIRAEEYKPNTQYTIGYKCYAELNTNGVQFQINYTDNSVEYYGTINATTVKEVVFSTNPNKSVLNISATYGADNINYIKDFYIYEGVYSSFNYIPYIVDKIEIPESIILNPCYGLSFGDRFNYLTPSALYCSLKKLVFTGDESDWMVENLTTGINFYYNIPAEGAIPNSTVLSNHFNSTVADATLRNNIWITRKVNVTANGYANLDEWKAQLTAWNQAGNPLTVIYKLENPYFESVENIPDLLKIKDSTSIIFEGENLEGISYNLSVYSGNNDVISADRFIGELEGNALSADYYTVNGEKSDIPISDALKNLERLKNSVKVTSTQIGQLATAGLELTIPVDVVANPPIEIGNIIIDAYSTSGNTPLSYINFWEVTSIESAAVMRIKGIINVYTGGGSASFANQAEADGAGNNIVSTYATKSALNVTDTLVSNIVRGTQIVGVASQAENATPNSPLADALERIDEISTLAQGASDLATDNKSVLDALVDGNNTDTVKKAVSAYSYRDVNGNDLGAISNIASNAASALIRANQAYDFANGVSNDVGSKASQSQVDILSADITSLTQFKTNVENGSYSVPSADTADKDGNGNNIVTTYATKTALDDVIISTSARIAEIGTVNNPVAKANTASNAENATPNSGLDMSIRTLEANVLTATSNAATALEKATEAKTGVDNILNPNGTVVVNSAYNYTVDVNGALEKRSMQVLDSRVATTESGLNNAIIGAVCTYTPGSGGGVGTAKLILTTHDNRNIEVSGFQDAIIGLITDLTT